MSEPQKGIITPHVAVSRVNASALLRDALGRDGSVSMGELL